MSCLQRSITCCRLPRGVREKSCLAKRNEVSRGEESSISDLSRSPIECSVCFPSRTDATPSLQRAPEFRSCSTCIGRVSCGRPAMSACVDVFKPA